MNVEAARQQMVDQQIRAWDVLDPRVLDAMGKVARERYVPAAFARLAYADSPIPLGNGHSMLAPSVDGRILQALGLSAGESVLEIGTGSGFLSACLSALGATVRSVEIDPTLAESAAARLRADGRTSVAVETADATRLLPTPAYDALVLGASLPEYDSRYCQWLRPGGRLFAVIGSRAPMEAILVTRVGGGEFRRDSLFETVIEPLVNATAPSKFRF
jgi:protein-L-isoaspartate(D-aspartate) O-methyltransferase